MCGAGDQYGRDGSTAVGGERLELGDCAVLIDVALKREQRAAYVVQLRSNVERIEGRREPSAGPIPEQCIDLLSMQPP